MFDTTESQTRLTKLAWVTALATLVIGQLHALARHRTEDGKSDLDLPATVVLGGARGPGPRPAAQLGRPRHRLPDLRQVVDASRSASWSRPAYMVMRLRAPYGAELWGWRLMLVGYVAARPRRRHLLLGPVDVLQRPGGHRALDGPPRRAAGARSARTVLGIALLRRGARPKLAAVLLLLTIPALFAISMVTSLGNTDLPTMFAVAMLASAETRQGRDRARRAVDPGGPGDTMSG